jgi:hypothetical protein
VLGWLFDDYENANTLTADISRVTATPLAEKEVADALERLCYVGRAGRYAFDTASSSYVPVAFAEASPPQEFWYLASAKGRAVGRS